MATDGRMKNPFLKTHIVLSAGLTLTAACAAKVTRIPFHEPTSRKGFEVYNVSNSGRSLRSKRLTDDRRLKLAVNSI